MLIWCEYEKHKAGTAVYLEALQKAPVEFWAGPHDGAQGLYRGLVIRLVEHPEGAYLFDGEVYRWSAKGCEQGVNNL